jgi:dolichyl-phosphate-mannose-protein mannosyltransferase
VNGGGERYFDRVDLAAVLVLTATAFVLRFFSPLLPDFFLHPFQGPALTNCVSTTPVDPQGDLGTLCGLAYPFNRGYPDVNGALSPPHGQVFDEVYFPVDAYDDVKGIELCHPSMPANYALGHCLYTYFDPEPPLAKEIIAAGEWGYGWYRATFQGASGDYIDLGFNTFGWRIAACLFGTLCIPMMYLLARRLWPKRLFAIVAATLVCFDGMFFIQSRIGMIDIFPIFFILLAYFVFMVHLEARSSRASLVSLVVLGIVLGIGIAAKWIVLAAWASIVFFLLLRLALHLFRREWGPPMTPGVNLGTYVAVGVVALALIPAFIYLESWYPFFARGQFHNLADLWSYQVDSYRYHATLRATHPYGSPAPSWPFLARPVLYYAEYYPYLGIDQFTGGQLQARMINLGNPWIWWTSLPCVVSLPYFVIRHRSFVAAVILLGFITQYAPWFPITRVLFLYHMFGGLVFMVMAAAFVLTHLAEQLRRPGREYVVAGYLGITVLFFGYFYPVWTAVPLSNAAWTLQPGTPPWGPKLWLVNCKPNPPPSQPQLFCWN